MDAVLYGVIIITLLISLVKTNQKPATLFSLALLACYALDFLDTKTLLHNFSNAGLLTLVLLMMTSLALEKTSWLRVIANKLISNNLYVSVFKISITAAISSAFLNNTAVVATLTAPIRRNNKHPASKLLIPLSYAAILGGTITLIGTSTNLIVNSFVEELGLPSLSMFSFLPIGLAATLIGIVVLLITNHFLPSYESQDNEHKQYIIEAKVLDDSSLIGKTVEQNGLRNLDSLFLVEIVRNGRLIAPVNPKNILRAGDKLIFSGDLNKLLVLKSFPGLELFADSNGLLTSNLQEVIITHNANLVGKSLKASGFRAKFDAAVVAIHRNGEKLSGKLGEVILQTGDRLLLATGRDFNSRKNLDKNFYFVSEHKVEHAYSKTQEKVLLTSFFSVIAASALNLIPLTQGLMFLLAGLLLTKLLSSEELKRRFPFELCVIIISALGLANSFTGSGLAEQLSLLLSNNSQMNVHIALITVFISTLILTEMITNNAAAALIFPLAYGISQSLGVNYMPFVMAVAFGASASFISPYSYQTNLIVFNAGNYKMIDFIKAGLPISLVYSLVVITLLPIVFPF